MLTDHDLPEKCSSEKDNCRDPNSVPFILFFATNNYDYIYFLRSAHRIILRLAFPPRDFGKGKKYGRMSRSFKIKGPVCIVLLLKVKRAKM